MGEDSRLEVRQVVGDEIFVGVERGGPIRGRKGGAVCGGEAGRIDLELEDERVNPKFAQLAVKAYLQRAGFPRETAVEIGGMEIGIYE